MKTMIDEAKVLEARAKVLLAFRSLRGKGIRAKANFMCCMGCATDAMDLSGKRGGVYWHRQAEESFKEYGSLYIGFFTENGKGSLEIGKDLNAALKARGLDVEWDGTSDTKVAVYVEGAEKS
jgi:hypothetical protein